MYNALRSILVTALLLSFTVVAVYSQQIEIAIESAEVTHNVGGRTVILVKPDAKSSAALNSLTASSLGRIMEIRLGDIVLLKARIRSPIGLFNLLSGDDTPELMERLSSKDVKLEVRVIEDGGISR